MLIISQPPSSKSPLANKAKSPGPKVLNYIPGPNLQVSCRSTLRDQWLSRRSLLVLFESTVFELFWLERSNIVMMITLREVCEIKIVSKGIAWGFLTLFSQQLHARIWRKVALQWQISFVSVIPMRHSPSAVTSLLLVGILVQNRWHWLPSSIFTVHHKVIWWHFVPGSVPW